MYTAVVCSCTTLSKNALTPFPTPILHHLRLSFACASLSDGCLDRAVKKKFVNFINMLIVKNFDIKQPYFTSAISKAKRF